VLLSDIILMNTSGNVPVSPALQNPTNTVEDVHRFASEVGYPIMVKAVDGGGGRGIRLIRSEQQLASLVKRAVEESPSKQIFAEKAAVDGFRHVEVQIIGDGTGDVTHLWERECSIQRRYQKVVELAPSVVPNRKLIAKVIEDALNIAKSVSQFKNL
jgi:pyruvate carboxylase